MPIGFCISFRIRAVARDSLVQTRRIVQSYFIVRKCLGCVQIDHLLRCVGLTELACRVRLLYLG